MHPVLIDFGIFKLHTYGLMMAIAFLVGMQLATREARRIDLSPSRTFDQFVLDLCFWILIAGMVGARILYIATNWEGDYANDPLKIFRIWEGGLVFYGGLIGATAFSVFYCIYKKHDFFMVADALCPQVAMGQFFGRLGCFAAGCCWGDPTETSPFGIQFPVGSLAYSSMQRAGEVAADATHTMHVHPSQLYESFGTLAIFFTLHFIRTRKRFHGQMLLSYMMLYAGLRFMLEFWRGDDKERVIWQLMSGFELSTSQIISIAWASIALGLLVFLLRRRGAVQEAAA